MKPVVVFRHAPTEGPGYFATFLDERRIAWRLVKLDEGEAVPERAGDLAGLAFMGGPMSANDALPWTAPVLALIRDAVARGVPVIGHCLGGQLLARALGAPVTRNPVKEIGWQRVEVEDSAEARDWLDGAPAAFCAFQWHGETFAIPPGGSRILRGEHCANQAYVGWTRHTGGATAGSAGNAQRTVCHIDRLHKKTTLFGNAGLMPQQAGESPSFRPSPSD